MFLLLPETGTENLNHHALLYLENNVLVCSFHPMLSSLCSTVPNAYAEGRWKTSGIIQSQWISCGLGDVLMGGPLGMLEWRRGRNFPLFKILPVGLRIKIYMEQINRRKKKSKFEFAHPKPKQRTRAGIFKIYILDNKSVRNWQDKDDGCLGVLVRNSGCSSRLVKI